MNEKAHVCTEYFVRRSLAEIGYSFCPNTLSYDKAMDFHFITGELAVLNAEKMEKHRKKGTK